MKKILLFASLLLLSSAQAQMLKSVIYDFDGLDIGQTSLPEGDYRSNDLTCSVAADPLGMNSPMLGDRVLKLNMNWNTGAGSFGRGISRFIELNPNADIFNFYFYNPTSNGSSATVDVLLSEDDDQSNTYSISNDDLWKKTVTIPGSSGWQLISIPLNQFTDNNAGGNGIFDATFTGAKGMILSLEMRFRGPTSGTSTYYMDMICFTDGSLPHGATVFDLPPGLSNAKCPLGAYEAKQIGYQYEIPGDIEGFFPAAPGKKIKYVNWFVQFAMDGSTTPSALPGNEVQLLLNGGYVPIITWEPMFMGYDRLDPVQPRLNNIINGDYDPYIDAFADKCKSYNDTMIIRFMHEFEGNWYSWSLIYNGQDPNRYINAYRHVVSRFKARGATKVKWMWCTNADYAPYRAYNFAVTAYPGDSYVDIVATDIYNAHWPTDLPWWMSFRYKAAESYYYLRKYIPQKPLLICEVGCRERYSSENPGSQTKGAWWGVMDKELQSNFKHVRGLVFFSGQVSQNWKINSSQGSLNSIETNIWNDPYYFLALTQSGPTVSITSPANNASFAAGSSITINATATAGSGSITKVEFFNGSTKLGEDLTSPYSFTWQNVPAGNYSLTAKVTNSSSQQQTSSAVSISVTAASSNTLIAAGSSWKYLDNGSNQGTAWRAVSFSDATWKTGNAQLGYGDGDEATVISYGSNSSNKYITTYFRKAFNVADRNVFSSLQLDVLRDDGAVVYLNGTEVYRSNMPAGTISYTTLASSNLGAPEESTFYTSQLAATLLVNGTNVIAVELHQSSNTTVDASFNLKLTGITTPAACGTPAGLFTNSITSSSAKLNWSAVQGATSYNIQYRRTGITTWTQTTSTVTNKTISGLASSGTYEYRVQAVCSSGAGSYSAVATFSTPAASSLITSTSSWKYLDNGTNQGTAWRTLAYSDAAWKTGNAQLGYGDGDEATIVSYGPNSANKYITTYFRKVFTVQNSASITALQLALLRDDGAVVYLNGTEVFRSNMPSGTIGYTTLATTSIANAEETTYYTQNISPSLLIEGNNIIAVEVHQSSPGSSDVSFALKLTATSAARLANTEEEDTTAQAAGTAVDPENSNDFDLVVSPNPAARIFTIDVGAAVNEPSATIQLFNISGQLVFETEKALNNGKTREEVSLPGSISVGVYILRVTMQDKKASMQVVITD